MAKNGRPKFKINYDLVEQLSSIMCTEEEIANILGCNVRTLQRDNEFCQVYKKGLDNGRMSLRRNQFHIAETNASMAIFLGKQYLNQRDIPNGASDITRVTIVNDLDNEKAKELNDE